MEFKTGRYQHFKGKFYKVIGVGRHSETLEEMVVYQAEYDDPKFGNKALWVRPKKMCLEKVEFNGKKAPGFKFMD
ncbi:MAG: DUF1653 domain-containing protein [Candidatus Woesearchaeota archaeon]